jgi:hypothetical protein
MLLTTFTPIQVRHAYGFDRVGFLDATHPLVTGDGRGTTIAIVDAYDDPNIAGDLATFDTTYGIVAPPSFTKVNQRGGTSMPAANPGWASEIALDVEYAHAMAPGANILLVEADSGSDFDFDTATEYAANQPGVVVVSMSFGKPEYRGQLVRDIVFTHPGVTYVAGSGDNGAQATFPATSPNVVAVGGTSLTTLDGAGTYGSESGWSGSGGTVSGWELFPAYQNGVVPFATTQRCSPDASFIADSVTIYDTYGGTGFYSAHGTSVSAPIMAGLVAITNQGRAYLNGAPSYNSYDFHTALYSLPQDAFHDVTTGGNGTFSCQPGYDLVTGRGSPNVPLFVAGMTGDPILDPTSDTLLIYGGSRLSTDTVTVQNAGPGLQVAMNLGDPVPGTGLGSVYTKSYAGSFAAIQIDASSLKNTINLESTPALTTRILVGNADTSVVLGNAGNAQNVQGYVSIDRAGPLCRFDLRIDDSADRLNHTGARAVTVSDANDTAHGRITEAAGAVVDYVYCGWVTLQTGRGPNDVNVLASRSGRLNLEGNSPLTTVTLGNAGHTLEDLQTEVWVNNPLYSTTLILDDSADSGNRSVAVDAATDVPGYGELGGLNPDGIFFKWIDIDPANGIEVRTGTGTVGVNVWATQTLVSLVGNSDATTVTVGDATGFTRGIAAEVRVSNPRHLSTLVVNDSGETNTRTVTLETVNSAGAFYGRITGLGATPAVPITYRHGDTAGVTVKTGTGTNKVNVHDTGTRQVRFTLATPVTLVGNSDATTVNVGNGKNGVQDILAALTVTNPRYHTTLNLDDAADAHDRTASVFFVPLNPALAVVTDLAPQPIFFKYAEIDPVNGVTVRLGTGTEAVNVRVNLTPLFLVANSAATTVTVGDGGNLGAIKAPVQVTSQPGLFGGNPYTALVIDGSADRDLHPAVILGDHFVGVGNQYGDVIGLAPATISYRATDIRSLTVNAGDGSNTIHVLYTPHVTTTITTPVSTLGRAAVNVRATNGPLVLNTRGGTDRILVGSVGNSLDPIQGEVTIGGGNPFLSDVTVNDQGSGIVGGYTYNLTDSSLSRPGAAAITFATKFNSFELAGGSGGSTFNVLGLPGFTTLTTRAGDSVNVGTAANTLSGFGTLNVLGASIISLNGQGDAAPTYTFDQLEFALFTTTGTSVYFRDAPEVFLHGGSGGSAINVQATQAAMVLFLFPGVGVNTITVGDAQNTLAPIAGKVTVMGGPSDTLTINDQGTTGGRTFDLNFDAVSWVGGPAIAYSGLHSVSVNGGSGGNTFHATSNSGNTQVSIDGGAGNNTLIGTDPTANNLWNITGHNSGTVAVGDDFYHPYLAFNRIQNLTATAPAFPNQDNFYIYTGGSIDGNLTGIGVGLLAYTGCPNYGGSVVVDLRTGFATGVGGILSGIDIVDANTGADVPGLYDLLIGNGACYLYGGTGRRNILVEGGAAGNLYGGGVNGEDILIAGSTVYDTEAGLTSWLQIAAYWAGADDRATRAANLLAGAGVPRLDATTVHGNGGGNYLIGQGSWALIFTDGFDVVLSPFDPASQLVTITP